MTGAETRAILDYWFDEIGADRWWTRSDQTDAEIRARFGDLWRSWRSRTPESFLENAEDALAGAILFDQFPRNMFRGGAEAFATDPLALAIASGAIEKNLDEGLDEDARAFLYMPFMHSETLADQNRCVQLFAALGLDEQLDYAKRHRDVIARFGRFPHRNAVLGRQTRPDEVEAVKEGAGW